MSGALALVLVARCLTVTVIDAAGADSYWSVTKCRTPAGVTTTLRYGNATREIVAPWDSGFARERGAIVVGGERFTYGALEHVAIDRTPASASRVVEHAGQSDVEPGAHVVITLESEWSAE